MRSIIREEEFEESLRALFEIPPEADEFTMAAEILLSEDPLAGTVANLGGNIRSLPMPPVDGKTVVLYYTFDETTVLVSLPPRVLTAGAAARGR